MTNRQEYMKEYNRKYSQEHQEERKTILKRFRFKHPEYQKRHKYYTSRKRKWIAMLGGKCQNCGYDKCIAALDFHHIGQSKEKNNHEYNRKSFIKKIEAGQIQLLCANCHRELHYNQRNNSTYVQIQT